MEIDADERRNLQAMVNRSDISATMATRVRIVLWYVEGRSKVDIAKLAGVSRPTVDLWLGRYDTEGVLGLIDRSHAAPREQVPPGSGPEFWRLLERLRPPTPGCRIGQPGDGAVHQAD